MDSIGLVKARLLFKLARRRNWGNSHAAFDNLKKGFHPREHGLVKIAAEELIQENLLFKKPTAYGLYVSLNNEKAQEIKQIVFDLLGIRVD